jgi:hypothetical protein
VSRGIEFCSVISGVIVDERAYYRFYQGTLLPFCRYYTSYDLRDVVCQCMLSCDDCELSMYPSLILKGVCPSANLQLGL